MKDSDYVEINSVNFLYLNIGEVDGCIEEISGNKYLTLVSTDKKANKYWQIQFNSDDNLPLNKTLKLHNMTIITRSVSEEDGKYYPQVFLDKRLYEL